jgi:hypothetical protein
MKCISSFAGHHGSYFLTNEIDHDSGAQKPCFSQWKPTGHSDLLLELRYRTHVHSIVTGIMRARRNLVNKEGAILSLEQFHTENAHPLECRYGVFRKFHRLFSDV